jgi:hypothetical protein
MEEIKSIRVRTEESNDIKITLYKSGNKRIVDGFNGVSKLGDTEYKGNRYNDLSDDEIISDYIFILGKRENRDTDYYKIIQDPWEEKAPIWRSYGFDPYYLNNGSKIRISWVDSNGFSEGGKTWSDENGEELDIKRGLTQSTKSFITKTVSILPPEDSTDFVMVIKDSSIQEKAFSDDFSGNTSDLSIITQVISYWKIKVPNYDVALCTPNNEFCNLVEYKSPIGDIEPDDPESLPTEESTQTQEIPKIKLSVVLPEDLNIKVKQDFNNLKVYIGEAPSDGFVFQDDFDNLEELDPEFMEDPFAGIEEGGEQYLSPDEGNEILSLSENEELGSDEPPNNTPGASTGIVSTGTYTSELPKESSKDPMKWGKIKYGYNGVPYYGQYDSRWRDVIYGLSNEGAFIEAKVTPPKGATWRSKTGVGKKSVSFNGKSYNILCDWYNGNDGFSSILGGGCGITSMSMIINYWMIKNKTGKYTSPIKMGKMASENGARSKKPPCNGTQPGSSLYKKIKEVYGLEMSSTDKSTAESLVKKGYPVMMCGTWKGFRGDGSVKKQNGGHFIVISGYDSSTKTYRVNDPGSQKGTYYFKELPKLAFWKILPPELA